MANRYGFVRDSRNAPSYASLSQQGITPLFNASDPYLEKAIAAARAQGSQYGIWDAPYGRSASDWAQALAAQASKYGPQVIVPDVEIEGKGYKGSPGWDYSDQFTQAYRNLLPNQQTIVAPMGLQDDFNYGAYTSRGIRVAPQAYGSTYATQFDPRQIRDRVIANGVDPSMVLGPVLAPGQSSAGLSDYMLYALDDFGGKYPSLDPNGSPGSTPAAPFAPGAPAAPGAGLRMDNGPEPLPGPHVPDSQNPAAIAYAQRRLHQLQAAGLIRHIPDGDPTAAWRSLSGQFGQALTGGPQATSRAHMLERAGHAVGRDTHKTVLSLAARAGASRGPNQDLLHAVARGRHVANAVQHLRRLRPTDRGGVHHA